MVSISEIKKFLNEYTCTSLIAKKYGLPQNALTHVSAKHHIVPISQYGGISIFCAGAFASPAVLADIERLVAKGMKKAR